MRRLASLFLMLAAVPAVALAAGPTALGIFDGWGAFRDPQVPRCYAIAQPDEVRGQRQYRPFASIGYWPKRGVRGQFHLRLSRAMAKSLDARYPTWAAFAHDLAQAARSGQLLGTRVRNVDVNIPHVNEGEHTHLYLDGEFDGRLADGVKILQEAPIGTGPTFAGWEGDGPLRGKLKLDVPLAKGDQPKVVVDFSTEQARLKLSEPPLELTQLKGDFTFDFSKGLSGQNITAQAFDKPIGAQIFAEGKPGQLQTRIAAKGQIALKALTDWLKVTQPL